MSPSTTPHKLNLLSSRSWQCKIQQCCAVNLYSLRNSCQNKLPFHYRAQHTRTSLFFGSSEASRVRSFLKFLLWILLLHIYKHTQHAIDISDYIWALKTHLQNMLVNEQLHDWRGWLWWQTTPHTWLERCTSDISRSTWHETSTREYW